MEGRKERGRDRGEGNDRGGRGAILGARDDEQGVAVQEDRIEGIRVGWGLGCGRNGGRRRGHPPPPTPFAPLFHTTAPIDVQAPKIPESGCLNVDRCRNRADRGGSEGKGGGKTSVSFRSSSLPNCTDRRSRTEDPGIGVLERRSVRLWGDKGVGRGVRERERTRGRRGEEGKGREGKGREGRGRAEGRKEGRKGGREGGREGGRKRCRNEGREGGRKKGRARASGQREAIGGGEARVRVAR